ncbi:MAG: response regulator transcription factor [Thermodesulfovibrionales bacterium]|nr:response regulator transcription factor [Thermodesulfovibrionales bacterium]
MKYFTEKVILLIDPEKSNFSYRLLYCLPNHNLIMESDLRKGLEFFIKHFFEISLVILSHSETFCCYDFLRYLRLVEPSIPILIVSDHSSEEFVATIFRLGAKDYVKRSQPLSEIKSTIANILEPKIEILDTQSCTLNSIFKALEFIHNNFYKNVRLSMAAKEAGMCISKFQKVFKEITGSNFSCYINKLRIAKSVEMLKKTNYTINHIALSCGYINQSHFNRTFKKFMKTSPKKFKKLLKSG